MPKEQQPPEQQSPKGKRDYEPAEIKLIPLAETDILTLSEDQGEWTPFII